MSSDEKRLTLSEIYDWMVDNVAGLKDQRYLHSAKGWKVSVLDCSLVGEVLGSWACLTVREASVALQCIYSILVGRYQWV